MTTLLQRLHDELVRRNYSPTTIRSYLHALRTCERYHRRVTAPRSSSALTRSGVIKPICSRRRSWPSGPWVSTSRRSASSLSACSSGAH